MKWYRLDLSVAVSDDISEEDIETAVESVLTARLGKTTVHECEEEKD